MEKNIKEKWISLGASLIVGMLIGGVLVYGFSQFKGGHKGGYSNHKGERMEEREGEASNGERGSRQGGFKNREQDRAPVQNEETPVQIKEAPSLIEDTNLEIKGTELQVEEISGINLEQTQ